MFAYVPFIRKYFTHLTYIYKYIYCSWVCNNRKLANSFAINLYFLCEKLKCVECTHSSIYRYFMLPWKEAHVDCGSLNNI